MKYSCSSTTPTELPGLRLVIKYKSASRQNRILQDDIGSFYFSYSQHIHPTTYCHLNLNMPVLQPYLMVCLTSITSWRGFLNQTRSRPSGSGFTRPASSPSFHVAPVDGCHIRIKPPAEDAMLRSCPECCAGHVHQQAVQGRVHHGALFWDDGDPLAFHLQKKRRQIYMQLKRSREGKSVDDPV